MTSSGDEDGAAANLAIEARGSLLLIGIRAVPGASRTEIRGVYGNRLKVAVNAPPEGGKANARLVEALAAWLDVRNDDVRVESGHAGRDKMVAFSGMNQDDLRDRLARLLSGAEDKRRTTDGS